MFNDNLSKIHFWGWQAIIVAAAITLPLGLSQAKEYAELSGKERVNSEQELNQHTEKGVLVKLTTKNGSMWRIKK
jgi:hypothetical protein